MNLDINPTIDQLRELVRNCDDSAGHHVLWINKNGDVELSCVPKDQTAAMFVQAHPEMQIRFETFLAGNEYFGPEAAADDDWISELFERMRNEWQKAKGKRDVAYVGTF